MSCAAHASCANTPGGFTCACDPGYTGDGTTACVPTAFTKLAVAGGFACGLGGDGGIYCWGSNNAGQLGDGTLVSRTRPVQVGTDTDWIDVDARTLATCGLKRDHSLWCWGFNNSGQLGDGTRANRTRPVPVTSDRPGVGWKAFAVGRQQVCAVHDDGHLACWGVDWKTDAAVTRPTAVDDNSDWTAISVGTVRCGLRGTPGHLYCWGYSAAGDLGLGEIHDQQTPMQVGTDSWRAVQVGYYNTCGVRSDGALLCWGNNPNTGEELQYGAAPQLLDSSPDWQRVSVASSSIIGVRAGGRAYGWGDNATAELAMAAPTIVGAPTPLGGTITSWSQIEVGNSHGCGIASERLYCWGQVGEGALGAGATSALYTPTRIGDDHWTSLAIAAGTCGLHEDGALVCWGNSSLQGVGFGNTDPVWTPTRLGNETWSAVAGAGALDGFAVTCALRGGLPYCWGDNTNGQLGTGVVNFSELSPVAVAVPPGSQWREIAPGEHTCAITTDGALWCWGANESGQLGTGAASPTPTRTPVAALPGSWLHVAVAQRGFKPRATGATCAIRADHTLWCWGEELQSQVVHPAPIQIGRDATWVAISMAETTNPLLTGRITACAIKGDGSLWCWGQWRGDGTEEPAATPVRVGDRSDWQSIAVGGEVCGTRGDGSLWCWANRSYLGNGDADSYDQSAQISVARSPTRIGSATDWRVAVPAQGPTSPTCAIKLDGSLWCWGPFAAPVPAFTSTPVPVN